MVGFMGLLIFFFLDKKCLNTFRCLRSSCPSGPNTVQVLYNFPSSSSGMDPGEQVTQSLTFDPVLENAPCYKTQIS